MEPEPIFGPYWNGQNNVYGDPLRIRRLLSSGLEGKVDTWCDRTKSDDPSERSQALGRIAQAGTVALDLTPFDRKTGRGVTESQAIRTVQLFLDWINGKKSNSRVCPTSPLPTDSGSPPPTTSMSGSSSTSTGSEDDQPTS